MAKLPRPPGYEDGLHMPSSAILVELGRIAIVSAGIEDILHALWWQFSGAGDRVGPVITEDMKPSRIADDLPKIGKAAKVPAAKLEDLTDIISQYRMENTNWPRLRTKAGLNHGMCL